MLTKKIFPKVYHITFVNLKNKMSLFVIFLYSLIWAQEEFVVLPSDKDITICVYMLKNRELK